jgi:hypothetical protein
MLEPIIEWDTNPLREEVSKLCQSAGSSLAEWSERFSRPTPAHAVLNDGLVDVIDVSTGQIIANEAKAGQVVGAIMPVCHDDGVRPQQIREDVETVDSGGSVSDFGCDTGGAESDFVSYDIVDNDGS